MAKERQQVFTFAILKEVKEYRTYNTINHGPVYILKKESSHFGKAGKMIDGVPSIRIRDEKKKTRWIPVDEIIIPTPKKPKTAKQRKAEYDRRMKKEGRKRVSLEISEDISLIVSAIKKKTGLSYSAIVEKILQDATKSKSIKSVITESFPGQIKEKQLPNIK